MKYVIRSDSERGFWSNTIGWVFNIDAADIYDEEEHKKPLYMPMSKGKDATWIVVDYKD